MFCLNSMLQSFPLINEGNIVLHSWIDINFNMLKKKCLAINFDAREILMKSISSLTHDLVNQANMFRLLWSNTFWTAEEKITLKFSCEGNAAPDCIPYTSLIFLLVHDSAIMTFLIELFWLIFPLDSIFLI